SLGSAHQLLIFWCTVFFFAMSRWDEASVFPKRVLMNGWIVGCRMEVFPMIEYTPSSKAKTSFSVPEMREMLGLGKTEAYWLVKKKYFKTIIVAGRIRVIRDSFEEWYANQYTYQKVGGPPPGADLKDTL